jgi:hypothetical protein
VQLERGRSPEVVSEEVESLLAYQTPPWEIVRALGVRYESVVRALQRAGADAAVAIFQQERQKEYRVMRPPRSWSCRGDRNCGHNHS